ncbi:MAG: hypothetical protein IKS55_03275 [Oscillospiraceae bacterium]|nr:hypothetical protein [Oscillospiraceae bacterium]
MENINVNEISETLAESLDNTQKNATDTENLVQQVQAMSGKAMHEKTVQAILDDEKLGMGEKLDFIHRENADYDGHEENNTNRVIRLQEAQTDNIGKVTAWLSQNWGWLLFGTFCLLTAGTPGGRQIAKNVVKKIAA